jgi:hypothetical protein
MNQDPHSTSHRLRSIFHRATVEVVTTSYAGGASPTSLSCPETSLSYCVFLSYSESLRLGNCVVPRLIGVVSAVEAESVDCRDAMRSSPLNTPRVCDSHRSVEARAFERDLTLTPHGQDGGAAAQSSRSNSV